jgi:cytochrome c556
LLCNLDFLCRVIMFHGAREYLARPGDLSDVDIALPVRKDSNMRRMVGALCAAAYSVGLMLAAIAATPEENHAAFIRRDEAMKQLGRSFNINIGRVASGKTQFSPDTIASAETVIGIIATLPTLFPPGSDVPESHLKSELLADPARADELIATVKADAAQLLEAVKTGDKGRIAVAYKTLNDACNACHNEFRKPYE